jgi:hypothetical protein
MKIAKFNKTLYGIAGGIVLPVIFFIAIVLVKKEYRSIQDYLNIISEYAILPKLMSLCLLPNLILFFGFIRGELYQAARGEESNPEIKI